VQYTNNSRLLTQDIKVGQRKFEQCKPSHVRPLMRNDRVVCACQQHVNTRLLYKGTEMLRRVNKRRYGAVSRGPGQRQDTHDMPKHFSDTVKACVCEHNDPRLMMDS
jgi:hypothetical protein